ncbi:hypothetical protein HAX54_035135 [Datura stramonium]|uniref:Uncharacterized protein n=1 Tax=Datura stramonium TaxID=4076 RepID=A0ABS8VG55_DATST|nr:hypothetical protein [Datura stramonium]
MVEDVAHHTRDISRERDQSKTIRFTGSFGEHCSDSRPQLSRQSTCFIDCVSFLTQGQSSAPYSSCRQPRHRMWYCPSRKKSDLVPRSGPVVASFPSIHPPRPDSQATPGHDRGPG